MKGKIYKIDLERFQKKECAEITIYADGCVSKTIWGQDWLIIELPDPPKPVEIEAYWCDNKISSSNPCQGTEHCPNATRFNCRKIKLREVVE